VCFNSASVCFNFLRCCFGFGPSGEALVFGFHSISGIGDYNLGQQETFLKRAHQAQLSAKKISGVLLVWTSHSSARKHKQRLFFGASLSRI
jgi:hypothetical protein